jgi:adenosylhomocysteine nucleosidase
VAQVPEDSLEGWTPEIGPDLPLATVVDMAFDYRGNVSVVKLDGSVGPGAGRLEERLARLVEGLTAPLLVSAGLCGGLAPALARGELVVPAAVLDGEGRRHAVAGSLPGRAARGEILTVGSVLATPEAKSQLYAKTGALAVDMESGPILAAAEARGWPALVVRAVSDTFAESLPAGLLDALDAGGRVRPARAALALLRPGTFWRALGLRRTLAAGLAHVADALRPLLG